MSTGNKMFICSLLCIPLVIALNAPYWYFASAVQLSFVFAQIGFDIRDRRRRERAFRAEHEAFVNQLRNMDNG